MKNFDAKYENQKAAINLEYFDLLKKQEEIVEEKIHKLEHEKKFQRLFSREFNERLSNLEVDVKIIELNMKDVEKETKETNDKLKLAQKNLLAHLDVKSLDSDSRKGFNLNFTKKFLQEKVKN